MSVGNICIQRAADDAGNRRLWLNAMLTSLAPRIGLSTHKLCNWRGGWGVGTVEGQDDDGGRR